LLFAEWTALKTQVAAQDFLQTTEGDACKVGGWSPFATGLAFVPIMGMVLPANVVAASVGERLGAPQTIALASVITAAGCVALLPMALGTSYWAIGAQLVVLGGGASARLCRL
jgi:hypothetical protein